MRNLLDWAEKNGLENLKGHRDTAEYLQRQAVTTLTLLLAGATGGLAYAIKGVELGSLWWAVGSAAFSLYLYVLSALAVCKTLAVRDIPSLHNEPGSLYQPEFSLEEIKEVELTNIQERINVARARNIETSDWLNRIRYAAVASPIIFVIVSLVVVWVAPSYLAEAAEHTASAFRFALGLAEAQPV